MPLYLGTEQVKINLDDIIYHLNLFTNVIITNNPKLLSSDNFVLQDSNELYITVKEDDE
jgi:hypothetical protein